MVVAPYPVFFPSPWLQVLSAMIHFLGLTVLTHCISRRVQNESLTYHGIMTMPWPRLSVILMFCDSWLFMISSGVLVFGFGLEYSEDTCTAAVYLCILFYATSKFFVYAFLAEKVHIVWSPTIGIRRFESPVYLTCIVSVSLYCIVMTLMLGAPIHENRENGACVIGLKPLASIPLLVYDLYINLFLTFMFLYPLVRSKVMSVVIRRLAVRTLLAAVVALSTSTINIVVLIVLHGRELGWVNLGACGADIMVNATAIFWVSGSKNSHRDCSSGRRPGLSLSTANIDIHFPTNSASLPSSKPKSTGITNEASGLKPVNADLERGDNGEEPTKPSWIGRLFSGENPRKQAHLNISVTGEFNLQSSQIELQRRSESEIERKIGSPLVP